MTLLVDLESAREREPWDHAHVASPCTAAAIFTITGEAPPGYLESIDKYFSQFAAPIFEDGDRANKPMVCLHCGADLTGMFGSFEWGIAHGEGHCHICGWPARAHHFARDEKGEELFTLRNFILQWMPDADAEARARDRDRSANADRREAAGPEGQEPGPRSGIAHPPQDPPHE